MPFTRDDPLRRQRVLEKKQGGTIDYSYTLSLSLGYHLPVWKSGIEKKVRERERDERIVIG